MTQDITQEFPTIEESLTHIRGHYNELYPVIESRRKTIGNIPERLHAEISEMATARNLRVFEIIAGMWDFYREYEATFEAELVAQRESNKGRR
tara:strand:- start:121 stop:399 length:279 start_codon:yes stop_codon:yes gene_type:complete